MFSLSLAMRHITAFALLSGLLLSVPAKAQTAEQWTQWGTVVHGGFGSLIAYGIRIGDDALKRLNAQRRDVIVEYADNPAAPCACVADGIGIAVTASMGQRSLKIADKNVPGNLLARVTVTHKKTQESVTYELPMTALAPMAEINARLPANQRYDAVMLLDEQTLYKVVQRH